MNRASKFAFTRMHKYLTAIVLPLVMFLINYFLFGNLYFSDLTYFGIATLVTLPLVGILCAVQMTIAGKSLRKYPSIHDTPKRILILLGIQALVTAIMITFIFWFYDALNILDFTFEKANWIRCLIAGFISSVI